MKCWIFNWILAWLLMPSIVYAVGSCPTIHSTYGPSDFGLSYMGAHFTSQDKYPLWAADISNQMLFALKSGANFSEVLSETAKFRGKLAYAQKYPEASEFGRRRRGDADSKFLNFDKETGPAESYKSIFALIEKRFAKDNVSERITDDGQPFKSIENSCTLMDGTVVSGSQVWLSEVKSRSEVIYDGEDDPIVRRIFGPHIRVKLWHSEIGRSRDLESDAIKRLRFIKDNPNLPGAKKLEMFIRSMFAYYNAMPFSRGSAAIGKVFFAASYYYYYLFGTKITKLPQDIDLRAMIQKETDFIQEMKPYF